MNLKIGDKYLLPFFDGDFSLSIPSNVAFRINSFLTARNIDSSRFAVFEQDANERLCIHQEGIVFWTVYFSERGSRTNAAFFVSFRDAVDFYVWKLIRAVENLPNVDLG